MSKDYQPSAANHLLDGLSFLLIPVMLINAFGGIFSGIWLAILGEWELIGKGLFLTIAGPFLLASPMLIISLAAMPLVVLAEKLKYIIFQVPLAAIGLSLTLGLMIVWAYLCQYLLLLDSTSNNIMPLIFWTYGAITGPYVFLAQKDIQAGNSNSVFTLFFYQIATILVMVLIGFFSYDIEETIVIYIVIMGFGLLFQLILLCLELLEQNRREAYGYNNIF